MDRQQRSTHRYGIQDTADGAWVSKSGGWTRMRFDMLECDTFEAAVAYLERTSPISTAIKSSVRPMPLPDIRRKDS